MSGAGSAPPSTPLELRLEALSLEVGALRQRVEALEHRAPATVETPVVAAAPTVHQPGGREALITLPLVGRTFLVLGGAYVLRALTEAGVLNTHAGVVAGLLYAALFLLLADRAGGSGARASAAYRGLASLAVALPLLVEATTRLAVLSPWGAAVLLLGFTSAVLAVACHRALPLLAWLTTLGALATAAALLLTTRSPLPPAACVLALAAGLLWLAPEAPWTWLRWPVALAADLLVAVVAGLAGRPAPVGVAPMAPIAAGTAIAFVLFLPLLYLGHFAIATWALRRRLDLFDRIQTPAALVVGFGGALHVAFAAGLGLAPLGLGGLAVAGAVYWISLRPRPSFTPADGDVGALMALALALAAAPLALQGLPLTLLWSTASLLAVLGAVGWLRPLLGLQSTAFALAAAIAAGVPAVAGRAFVGGLGGRGGPDAAYCVAAAAALAAHLIFSRGVARCPSLDAGTSRAALALTGAVGFCAWAGALAHAALALTAVSSPPAAAAVRSVVLALAALALALAGRFPLTARLAWLAHPVLVLGGLKLVFSDLRSGGTAPLVVSFAGYGTALIFVPQLRRWARRAEPAGDGDPPAASPRPPD